MAASETRVSDALLLRAFDELLIAPAKSRLRPRRRLAGYAVAVVVGLLADNAVRYAGRAATAIVESEAARPIAQADRMRTALLAAVSHDLRTPLAAAKAAMSCLRSTDIQLTAEDHDELLATADESLDQLSHLLASLLDVSRLQAGALPVFPRPANLEEIIARTLGGIGPQARAVMVRIPPELPRVMADPPIMERVIANVTTNALRYSPGGSPPLLTASARGGRVILRVVDYGPGVPEADRDRIFAAFQRLGDNGRAIGVGLGLTVSRGLTEAMGGTLEPEETPGGGLTMAISVPIASGAAQPQPDSPARPSFVPRAESTCRTVNRWTVRPPSGLVTDSEATVSYASPSPQAAPYQGLSPMSVRVEKDLAGQPGHLARSDGTCLRPAPGTRDRGAMTEDTLISLQSAATRIACQRMTAQHLNALHASVEQASCLSARYDWERKATAHAELFNLLGDSIDDPLLVLLVGSATGWLHDLLMAVGPRADGIILSSRRRLLRHLRTRDADGAAREIEHHLMGLRYMGRLARGTISGRTTPAS